MLYDRPYMKATDPPTRRLGVLSWLIITEIIVFVVQHIVWLFLGPEIYRNVILDFFALSGETIQDGKVWTFLTYGFLHDTGNIFHILFNLLGLFFVGRIVIKIFGEKAFLEAFLISTFAGGLLYLLVHLNGNGYVLGVSGALMGIITLFCLARPEEEVTVLLWFIIPVTLKPKWLLWGVTGFSLMGLLFWELPAMSTTAHSAHLGGIIGGFFYYQLLKQGKSFINIAPKIRFKSTSSTPPPKSKTKKVAYSINFSNREKLKSEVDRILDKINEKGFGSLTAEERKTLDEARDILRK